MKKWMAVILLLALLLTGCGKKEKIVVNAQEHTISDGTHTYEYSDTIDGDTRTIIIYYPDGGKYTWTQNSKSAHGHMEVGQGISSTANGTALACAILDPQSVDEPEPPDFTWVLIVVGILAAGYGLWQVLFPVTVWNIFMRHWYQEDPGEYALTRIIKSGIRLIVVGVTLLLGAILA